jgi:hypothetical protein
MGTLINSNNAYLKTCNTLREVLIYLYIKKNTKSFKNVYNLFNTICTHAKAVYLEKHNIKLQKNVPFGLCL